MLISSPKNFENSRHKHKNMFPRIVTNPAMKDKGHYYYCQGETLRMEMKYPFSSHVLRYGVTLIKYKARARGVGTKNDLRLKFSPSPSQIFTHIRTFPGYALNKSSSYFPPFFSFSTWKCSGVQARGRSVFDIYKVFLNSSEENFKIFNVFRIQIRCRLNVLSLTCFIILGNESICTYVYRSSRIVI